MQRSGPRVSRSLGTKISHLQVEVPGDVNTFRNYNARRTHQDGDSARGASISATSPHRYASGSPYLHAGLQVELAKPAVQSGLPRGVDSEAVTGLVACVIAPV